MNADDESTTSSLAGAEDNAMQSIIEVVGLLKITETSSRCADHKACKGVHMCVLCKEFQVDGPTLVDHLNVENHKVSAEKVKAKVKAAQEAYDADPSPFNKMNLCMAKLARACLKLLRVEARRVR
jgi:hypothetical protein